MRSHDAGMSDRGSEQTGHESKKPPTQTAPDGKQKADDKNALPREQPPKQTSHGSGGSKSTPGSGHAQGAERAVSNPKGVEDELNEPDGYDDESNRPKGGKSGGRGQADGRQ